MPNGIFVPADDILERIDRSTLATLSLADYEAGRRSYEALGYNGAAKRKRRERKPRVPAQFDKAIKAGLPARLERRPDGTVIVEIGQAGAASNIAEPDPWERAMQRPKQ
jgi:hypothetical protein